MKKQFLFFFVFGFPLLIVFGAEITVKEGKNVYRIFPYSPDGFYLNCSMCHFAVDQRHDLYREELWTWIPRFVS